MRLAGFLVSTLAVLALAADASSQAPAARPARSRTPTVKPAPPAPPVLEGIVRGPDRKPIEKALVAAAPAGGRSFERSTPVWARTDANGRFRLALRRNEPQTVRVEASGLAATTRRDVTPGTSLTFDLAAGGVIEGTVRDGESGQPAANLRVVASQPNAIAVPEVPDSGRVVARTDASGRFRLPGLASGLYQVSASGRGRSSVGRAAVRPGTKLDLVVFPSGSVFGTSVGPDGRPVPGATVGLALPAWGVGAFQPVDERGAFELNGLHPGVYDIVSTAPGFAPAVAADVAIDRRTEARVDLVLRPGARAVGRLVDASERPVAGKVGVRDLDGRPVSRGLQPPYATEAGVDGRFTIDGLPAGDHALGVDVPGLAARRVEFTVRSSDRQLDLGDVRLEVGLAIRGRVRSKAGVPLADALVSAHLGRLDGTTVEARSEPDGTFVLPGLERGTYRVFAEAVGYGTEEKTTDTDGGPLVLVLSPAGVISGRVVDDRGQPIDAFNVTADSGGDFGRGRDLADLDESGSVDGSFRLSGVPAGTYAVSVAAPERPSVTLPAVAVAEGQAVDVGTVKLAPGGIVRGTVVDDSGGAVSGASVHASMARQGGRASGSPVGASTDEAGAFELKGLSAGRADLGAQHPSYAPADRVAVEVDPAKPVTDVRLVLPRGGRIEGSVRSRDGGGRTGVSVHVAPSATERIVMTPSAFASTTTAADGTFALDHVLAGPATLTTSARGDVSPRSTLTVEVREGETTAVEIVEREILLSGRVTRSAGPGAGLRLEARSAKGGVSTRSEGGPVAATELQQLAAVTREDGTFEMRLDEPGPYWIGATVVDGSVSLPGRFIEVPDADSHAIELAYDSVRVTGIVVDAATNAAVENAAVSATPRDAGRGSRSFGLTGLDGRFHLEMDPAEYSFSARHRDGYRPAETTATVGTSGLTDVRLELAKGFRISGTVRQPNGQPAVGISVRAAPVGGSDGGAAHTRADGSFEIDGLEEGAFTVVAQASDGGFALQKGVRTGERANLNLRPGGRLAVTVTTASGDPIPGAVAIVSRVDGTPVDLVRLPEHTDAQGRTEFLAPAGTLTLYGIKNGSSASNGSASVALSSGGTAAATIQLRDSEAPAP